MNKKSVLFLIISLAGCMARAQEREAPAKKIEPAKSNTVAAGVLIPLGDFSSSHLIGAGIDYSRSKHRFGAMQKLPAKKFAFACRGGIAYYFGKKVTVGGYPYDYPGYFLLHALGGLLYTVSKKNNLELAAGPALGVYRSRTRFNIGAVLEGTHFFNARWGLAPSVHFIKESGADPIWSFGLKAVKTF